MLYHGVANQLFKFKFAKHWN